MNDRRGRLGRKLRVRRDPEVFYVMFFVHMYIYVYITYIEYYDHVNGFVKNV
jgi:hypothetical protein